MKNILKTAYFVIFCILAAALLLTLPLLHTVEAKVWKSDEVNQEILSFSLFYLYVCWIFFFFWVLDIIFHSYLQNLVFVSCILSESSSCYCLAIKFRLHKKEHTHVHIVYWKVISIPENVPNITIRLNCILINLVLKLLA